MPTLIKTMLLPIKKNKDGKRTVVLRLTINNKRHYVGLKLYANEKDWSEKLSRLKRTYNPERYKEDNERISLYENKAKNLILYFQKNNIDITIDIFKEHFLQKPKEKITVFEFYDDLIKDLEEKGKIGTAISYKQSKSVLLRFYKKNNLSFKDIDVKFLNKCEVFLSKNVSGNSISVYYRSLRAIFNRAISQGICKTEDYPFYNNFNQKGYKIKKLETPTRKRAIKYEEIKKIINYKTEKHTSLHNTQNIFLFSFYNMGMNFIDIAYLKWSDISDGRINFTRQKSKKIFSIEILPPVQKILDYYIQFKDELNYIFPIFTEFHKTAKQMKTRTQTSLKKFNKEFKELARLSGVENYKTITSYVVRHSWATTMKKLGHSVTAISEGMKHSDEQTTQIYLDSFENSTIDDMNKTLLNL